MLLWPNCFIYYMHFRLCQSMLLQSLHCTLHDTEYLGYSWFCHCYIFLIGFMFNRLSKSFIFLTILTLPMLHRLPRETVKRQVIFRLSYSPVHENLVKIIASSPACCNHSCAKYSPPLLTVQYSTYTQPKFFVQWKLENTKNCRRHSYTPDAAAMIKRKEACVTMARSTPIIPLRHLSIPPLYPTLQFAAPSTYSCRFWSISLPFPKAPGPSLDPFL